MYSETWQSRISVETEQISKSRRNSAPINAYLTWMKIWSSVNECILQIHLINPNTLFVVPSLNVYFKYIWLI